MCSQLRGSTENWGVDSQEICTLEKGKKLWDKNTNFEICQKATFSLFNLLSTEKKNRKSGRQWSHPVDLRQLRAKALRRRLPPFEFECSCFFEDFVISHPASSFL